MNVKSDRPESNFILCPKEFKKGAKHNDARELCNYLASSNTFQLQKYSHGSKWLKIV